MFTANKKLMFYMPVSFLLIGICAGCNSYAEKKEAAYIRWEKITAKAKVSLARGQFETGRADEAEEILKVCIRVVPELADAHLLMARIKLSQGKFAEAEESCEVALEIDRELDKAWYYRGQIAQQAENFSSAMVFYNAAMAIEPVNVSYILATAECYAAANDYDSALDLLETKSELLGGNVALKVVAADILVRTGQTKRAVKIYSHALLLSPDDVDIVKNLAYCYLIDKQWASAAEMFARLAENSNGQDKQRYLEFLAMCSVNIADYGRALNYYDQLSVAQRDNPEFWLKMGRAALGAGSPARALSCVRRALVLRSGWAEAIALKGCAQYLNRDYSEAVRTFARITANKNKGGFAWIMTARCYQHLGQVTRADKAYDKALQMNPESELTALMDKSR